MVTPEQTKFFFEELLPGYTKRALQVKTNNLKYANLIADSIELVISFANFCTNQDFAYKDKLNDIFDGMRVVFDCQQKFYQSHF